MYYTRETDMLKHNCCHKNRKLLLAIFKKKYVSFLILTLDSQETEVVDLLIFFILKHHYKRGFCNCNLWAKVTLKASPVNSQINGRNLTHVPACM